jgi:hypothetical protein
MSNVPKNEKLTEVTWQDWRHPDKVEKLFPCERKGPGTGQAMIGEMCGTHCVQITYPYH